MNTEHCVIKTANLTKSYGKAGHEKKVVDGVALSVPEGCIYGFLGPNGAGKSTTMKMLLGLVKPTCGEITVLDQPLVTAKSHVASETDRLKVLRHTGSLIESPAYYGHLTGRENLEVICSLKGVPTTEIDEVLSIVRMEKQQNKKAGQYSLGMKQRLGLAGALLGHPRLLLLDEPTNGLDPSGIQEIRELIRSLPRTFHTTVMVSSHLLGEIDQMADYAGIIHNGKLIYQDSMLNLHAHSNGELRLRTDNNSLALRLLSEKQLKCRIVEDYISFPETADRQTALLVSLLVQNGIGILRLTEYQKSLEDIFLGLTGKQVSL